MQAFAFQSSNFWGGGEAHVKMTKEQLEKIDAALPEEGAQADAKTVADLQAKVNGFVDKETAVQEALTGALELNGIEAVEGQSPAEAIAALGVKCKEFGDSTETHSIPKTDGVEKPDGNGLKEGFFDPNAEHNKIV